MTEFDFALLEVFYSLTDSVCESLEGKGISEADTLRDFDNIAIIAADARSIMAVLKG